MYSIKKPTITVPEEVYRGLRKKISPRKISRFLDQLARPYVTDDGFKEACRAMAADGLQEAEAKEWSEGTAGSALDN